MEAMHLVRSGKNATHIDKASKAYAYRQIMDQLCIETYREQDVLVLDGCRLVVPTDAMLFFASYMLDTAASQRRSGPPSNSTSGQT